MFQTRFFQKLRNLSIPLILVSAMAGSLISGCSSVDNLVGGEEIEGWRLENGIDVFYMRMAGSASDLARKKDDLAMMKTTCIESTQLQASDRVIRKMLGEYTSANSMVVDGRTAGYIINSVRQGLIKGTNVKECASMGSSNWENCECIHYVKGKNLKKEFEFQVEEARAQNP